MTQNPTAARWDPRPGLEPLPEGESPAVPADTGSVRVELASAPGMSQVSALDAALGNLMGDAPFCDVCGHITVRNGACYKCLNCGNSLGCS